MKNQLTITLIMMALMSTLSGCSKQETADLILLNGSVYTMDPQRPTAPAIAVQGDRIVYVGSEQGVEAFRRPETRILNLHGKTVLPGLVDAHAHLHSLGMFLENINLIGTTSKEQIRQMVLERIADTPEGEWIQGRGWDQNDWDEKDWPTWQDFQGTESHPVYLRRVDGHASWVNKAALDLCGITVQTADTAGGQILRDRYGNPTGVFIDNASDLIKNHIPEPTPDVIRRRIKTAIEKCHSVGLVGIHDAGVDSVKMAVYMNLVESGDLNFRVYAMVDDEKPDFVERWLKRGAYASDDHLLTVKAIKTYADGALGSRGAYLLEPYADDPGNRGLMIHNPDYYENLARRALEAGFQLCTHAIGDGGNRVMLDAYEKALAVNPVEDHRFRVEHAQVLSLDDIPRFARLGVIPSMQPTHATSDMYWVEDRIGAERTQGAYAWRKLLNSGSRIPCGSDFPVENPNPLWGIFAAVTRQDHTLYPAGGWNPEERMTIDEAVRGFTLEAAYARFAEDDMGSIEVGKLADFTVLDQDIFKIPPEKILETRVVYTIVAGKIVYQSER
jgi:predicted amidohydrolase YtcJ